MRPRLILVTLVLTALALTALAPTGCQLVNMSRLYLANDWTAHRWNTDQDKVDLPLRLDSHVLVPIRVNGSEPLDFVLDTGAPMTFLVGSERTRHLGLRLGSSVALGGSGTGSTPTGRMVRQLTVSVGSVDLLNQTAVLLPWRELPFFDSADDVFADGGIGYDLLKRFVVQLDFDRGVLSLIRPERFDYRGPGTRLPLMMHMRKPYVHAQVRLDGAQVPVKLHVDLGNRGTLSLIPGSASGLEIPPDTTVHQGFGLSGRTHSRLGRIDRLTLGRFALSGVDTTFSTSGYATAGGRHGVLGLGILQRFTVIFDYSRDVMYLECPATAPGPC